jgi:peptidyl-prolyl cis-trans isomerase D
MLATFRRHLNSWVARLFFLLLVATFVLWGVGDVIRNAGTDGSLAVVDGHKIELPEAQEAYRRQLAQVTQMFGGKVDPTPEMKQGIAGQALEQVITQAALNVAATNMGLGVSENALREAVADIPNFHGPNGQFDRATYDAVLRNNNMTEARLLTLLRADLLQRQLLGAARAGVASPETLTKAVYDFQQEKRVAEIVQLPFSAAPAPPTPDDAQLTRWYENHKEDYATPEMRRIKAVVLSPQTVAHDIQISDDDLKAAYEARKAEFVQPEKRSVQVLLAPDEAKAQALAAQWAAGADWAAIQKGNGPVELTDATAAEFPAPELAKAVFAAQPDTVAPPVRSPLGWHVFKVTKVTPGSNKTLDQVRDTLRAAILADRAADVIDDDAGKVQDALAGGSSLDDLPGNLGLAAVTGTLDAQGNTSAGKPAPIPGSDALRSALIAAAFQMKKGDLPQLTEGPKDDAAGQGYFAVTVEDITPPATKPMADVIDAVRQDWTHDAIRHSQEVAAARILTEVKGGETLDAAAAGLTVTTLPPAGRSTGAPGMPAQLLEPLFSLKQGEPTMVETDDGFTVAVLSKIIPSDPNTDPLGYGQIRDALTSAVGNDVQMVLVTALRARANPRVQSGAINSIVQSE